MDGKVCPTCKTSKPRSEFHKDSQRKDGMRHACKTCYMKRWNELEQLKGRDVRRDKHLRETYGITLREYELLRQGQGGGCAVCHSVPVGEGNRGSLHVDHDHETGKIRGLLCFNCNAALGQAKDSADRLRALAAYLDRNSNGSI